MSYTMESEREVLLTRSERLVDAARRGDMQQTVELLRHIPKDFDLGASGECALQELVRNGQLVVMDLLLDRGVSALATDAGGTAPLHIAVMNNHAHIVTHLVNTARGVRENINQVTRDGYTAYQLAVKHGHTDIASKLVEFGAEPRNIVPRSRFNSMTSPTQSTPPDMHAVADYVLKIGQHENAVDESIHKLQQKMQEMTFEMQQSFKQMQKMVTQVLSKQTRDTKQLSELKLKMDQVEKHIVQETGVINDGMDALRARTEQMRTTFHQSEEYNEMVYFHVFQIIAKTVGMKRDTWRKLCESLLADYPPQLVNKVITEVSCCVGDLSRYFFYVQNTFT